MRQALLNMGPHKGNDTSLWKHLKWVISPVISTTPFALQDLVAAEILAF
jgi:hypothetical protein